MSNLEQRLSSVMAEVPNIKKRGHNSYSKYDYVLAVDVIHEISRLLVKYGISLSISELELVREKHDKNFHTTIKSLARFTNIDDPKEYREVEYYSISADTLDKDIYKAKTNGLKYLFTQMFLIVTDNVIDAEQETPRKKENTNVKTIESIYSKLSFLTKGYTSEAKKQFVKDTLGVDIIELRNKDPKFLEDALHKLEYYKELE